MKLIELGPSGCGQHLRLGRQKMSQRMKPNSLAMAISALVGAVCMLAPQFSALADDKGTNIPNFNSGIKPGQDCSKLKQATQEYKDCISGQAMSHQNQGKNTNENRRHGNEFQKGNDQNKNKLNNGGGTQPGSGLPTLPYINPQ